MRGRVVKMLRPLDAVPVENPARPGTPDVNYIGGWIELKWMRRWPARANTPVRLEHYSPEQRAWAMRRRHRGGTVWMLLQVGREWVLLDGAVAATSGFGSKLTRSEIYCHATRSWKNGINAKELRECISREQSAFSFTAGERT